MPARAGHSRTCIILRRQRERSRLVEAEGGHSPFIILAVWQIDSTGRVIQKRVRARSASVIGSSSDLLQCSAGRCLGRRKTMNDMLDVPRFRGGLRTRDKGIWSSWRLPRVSATSPASTPVGGQTNLSARFQLVPERPSAECISSSR